MAVSGAVQADQFEKLISKSRLDIHLSSGLWPRYLRGDVMPQGSLERHKTNLVFRLERFRPATADIFYHPIWELFNFDKLLGPRELRTIYAGLNKSVWEPFMSHNINPDESPNFERSPFWKILHSPESLNEALSQIDGFDGVAVCLIEARMAYLAQDEDEFTIAMMAAYSHLDALAKNPEFEFPKLQSAFLVLQTMCLRFVGFLMPYLLVPPSSGDDMCELFQARYGDWNKKIRAHAKSLPRHAASQFAKWSNQVARREYAW